MLLVMLRGRGRAVEGGRALRRVGVIVWKLAVGYVLYNLQQRSFALHEYYGGMVRNGVLVLVASIFLGARVLTALTGGNLCCMAVLG